MPPLKDFCRFHTYFVRVALLLGVLISGGGKASAQTWISAVSVTTTATTARVMWTTAVPADSQVEYGTTASYGSVTALSTTKVASHAVAISGLAGGTTYHFRVRSSDANGSLVMGPDYALTVSASRLRFRFHHKARPSRQTDSNSSRRPSTMIRTIRLRGPRPLEA